MKAYVRRRFGGPEVLAVADLDTPLPGDDEVLVRVHATSVNPYDWHHLRGEPYVARLMASGTGLFAPGVRILGCDMAGRVEAIGRNVTRFAPGDDVYALLTQGAYAEYVCVPENRLAPMPRNLSHAQAATIPMAGITALLALRDAGRVEAGQDVVITAAAGGVGTFAVQLARALGAKVTAVCGPGNAGLVRSIGATEALDYTAGDFTRGGSRHDLAVDIAGRTATRAWRRILTPEATLVLVGGPPGRWFQPASHIAASFAAGRLVPQRVVLADVTSSVRWRELLEELTGLVQDGAVTPVLDRTYAFEELPEAIRYQEQGHVRGKLAVDVSPR
jgi:NADPH:quinone reductase-like Zn-dependent oxidoreductase